MPATELAEARRAFGFFETVHACITAEAQPRKRHRKETSAMPEPMQDPRRNWRKLDERLDFSRLFTPASPQEHSREKDTARRLLPCKTCDGTGGSSTSVWIFRDYSRLHHRRGTAEKKTPQGDFCHSGAHARPTTARLAAIAPRSLSRLCLTRGGLLTNCRCRSSGSAAILVFNRTGSRRPWRIRP